MTSLTDNAPAYGVGMEYATSLTRDLPHAAPAWPGEKLQEVARTALRAATSRPGWDAWPVDPRILDLATHLLAGIWHRTAKESRVVLCPQVFPLHLGGLQLEWHADNDDVEITVDRSDVVGLYWSRGGTPMDVEIAPSRSPIPIGLIATIESITKATVQARQ